MEVIIKAKNVNDAVAEGAEKLGVNVADVRYEVVEEAKKGFLGIGASDATVRVYLAEDEADAVSEDDEVEEDANDDAEAEEEADAEEPVYAGNADDLPPVEEKVIEFLQTVIADMGVEAKAAVSRIDERMAEGGRTFEKDIHIDIIGKGLGMLIGRHGDVLDALQYLCNIVVGRYPKRTDRHEYIRIVLDIENYRAKREDTLKALARRQAAKVVSSGRNYTLEPMSAYERRIIHSELQSYRGVHTFSVGAENNRKVVIAYGDEVTEDNQ